MLQREIACPLEQDMRSVAFGLQGYPDDQMGPSCHVDLQFDHASVSNQA